MNRTPRSASRRASRQFAANVPGCREVSPYNWNVDSGSLAGPLERYGPGVLGEPVHDSNEILPTDLVTPNRRIAETALRAWTPVFTHGDLQVDHVFVDGDEITGVVDWSEAGQGDALYDIATLTLGQQNRLSDLLAGYGSEVDVEVIRAWWSWRSLTAVRWLVEHGFDPHSAGCEVDVLRSQL